MTLANVKKWSNLNIVKNPTLFRSNRYLCHHKKGTEIKIKSKSRYHNRSCNRMVRNNAIRQQKIDINREISWNSVVNFISYTNVKHEWPKIRIYWSWVQKTPNWKRIRDNCQAKHFGKSYLQCDIGTDSTGSEKPSVNF